MSSSLFLQVNIANWKQDYWYLSAPVMCCKVKLSCYMPWRYMGERRYSSDSYLTSALNGGEWSVSRPGHALPPGERAPGIHWTGGWVGLRASLDAEATRKILCLCQGSNPGCPVCWQTLYWLSYPSSQKCVVPQWNNILQKVHCYLCHNVFWCCLTTFINTGILLCKTCASGWQAIGHSTTIIWNGILPLDILPQKKRIW
jgi:hypothetical protein